VLRFGHVTHKKNVCRLGSDCIHWINEGGKEIWIGDERGGWRGKEKRIVGVHYFWGVDAMCTLMAFEQLLYN